jgi:type I restriction enzyme M protein
MLDQTTKRKLDSARQILVGKVPDPKAQVEQITTALVYKFMDDMDKESEELGGEAKFFANGFSQYAWSKLMDNKLSGQERLDLYVQAITNMSKNPHIPQLFRDIFKGAFLPYNDPRTLSLFLKEINEFNYEHSENLGNAFEYLLSILGSQGDAGQFRTPRHIIDFIVEVVDPKKNETILDPACGTAGFLISAYKHILKTNKEKPLTPDEKLKLMNNLAGYDISPDMVKLALVNMYLHGFPEPKIHEYDSLSSEKRWDETFDVILANPPFMTPKGGITPHKRFSIQAKRSEVLFVDYIVEHLTIKGRAGIIVPEGIIFQSNKAYTALRKKLVEDGLLAVVSLPPGVFNPYSGVKTSILLFDTELAKRIKNVLFVKIQHDGFDLGAQRREIDKNDLPLALQIIRKFKATLSDSEFSEDEKQRAHVVAKEKIIESGDYNLSGERYKEVVHFIHQKWPMVELGEVVEILDNKRKPITKSDRKSGQFPYYGATGILDYVHDYIFDERLVLIGEDGAKWGTGEKTAFIAEGKYWVNNHAHVVRPIKEKLIDVYLVFYLNSIDLSSFITGVTVPKLNQEKLRSIKIPLPPLEVQKEIVEQIEVKQKAIDHAKAVIESLEKERRYFGQALRKLEGVEWVELGEVCEKITDGSHNPPKEKLGGGYYMLSSQNIFDGFITFDRAREITEDDFKGEDRRTNIQEGDVLLTIVGTIGRTAVVRNDLPYRITLQRSVAVLKINKNLLIPEFLSFILRSEKLRNELINQSSGVAQKGIYLKQLGKIKIPLPPLEIQKQLVAEAEKEEEIITANRRLIEIMERKIEEVLSNI